MAHRPARDVFSPLIGALTGAIAYLLGLGFVLSVQYLGFHPESGIWMREFTGAESLILHAGAHLPVWGGEIHFELLVHTVLLMYLLVLAGFVTTRMVGTSKDESSSSEVALRTGGSIVFGYLPATFAGNLYALVALDAITATQLFAPTLLVGVFYPIIFGGAGGALANWLDSR